MKSPLVSVVMNCRNGERFVLEAIQSVLDQTIGDFELVFWDNRSTDSTAEIVRGIQDPRIRYFLSDSDDSLGQARNRAFSEVSGEWVAILDSDDIWLPNFLEAQLAGLKETGASMIYSNATMFYPDGREILFTGRPATRIQEIDYKDLTLNYDIHVSATVFHHSVLEGLSFIWDPEMTVQEDKDLFIRIAHRHPVVFNPETLVRYRVHASSDTWRHGDDFIRDAEKLIINMKEAGIDPEFARDKILEHAYWLAAKASWMKSDGALTRHYLRSIPPPHVRFTILFYLSFLPYRMMAPIFRIAGKQFI